MVKELVVALLLACKQLMSKGCIEYRDSCDIQISSRSSRDLNSLIIDKGMLVNSFMAVDAVSVCEKYALIASEFRLCRGSMMEKLALHGNDAAMILQRRRG